MHLERTFTILRHASGENIYDTPSCIWRENYLYNKAQFIVPDWGDKIGYGIGLSLGMEIEFRSEKIPQNRLGTVPIVLIPRSTEDSIS